MNGVTNNKQPPKSVKKFWQPANIIVVSILTIIVAGGAYLIWVSGGTPRVIIDSAHQQCTTDTDCVMVMTENNNIGHVILPRREPALPPGRLPP